MLGEPTTFLGGRGGGGAEAWVGHFCVPKLLPAALPPDVCCLLPCEMSCAVLCPANGMAGEE